MRRFLDDFPDELLLKVVSSFETPFDEAELRFDSEFDANIRTIQNLRLTCRRLSEIGSQFLVPYIHVAPTLASLNHVDQVASHPTISRGLRRIFVDMSVLRLNCANKENNFYGHWSMKLDEITREEDGDLPRKKGFRAAAHEYLMTLQRAQLRSHPFDFEEYESPVQSQFKREFARYGVLYREQKEILTSDRLARTISAAAARSRSSIGLYILDQHVDPVHGDDYGLRRALKNHERRMANPDFVVEFMRTQLGSQWSSGGDEVRQAAQFALCELPLVLSAAGVKLTELVVDTTAPASHVSRTVLNMTRGQISALKQVSKSLDTFDFRMRGKRVVDSHRNSLSTYISAVTSSQMVTNLRLDLAFIHDTDSPTVPSSDPYAVGPLRFSETWDRLENLMLSEYSVHLKQLENLVSVVQPGINITLREIRLSSGTWAEALDCMRAKAGLDSQMFCCTGAEIETMSHKERKSIFGESSSDNLATRYIRSDEGISNPLQPHVETSETAVEP